MLVCDARCSIFFERRGYRFTVIPLQLRLDDTEALDGLNPELGFWLADLLLSNPHSCELVRKHHILDICEVVMQFVRRAQVCAVANVVCAAIRLRNDCCLSATSHILCCILTCLFVSF